MLSSQVRALMDLLYLGKSRLPMAKLDAFKALKEDL